MTTTKGQYGQWIISDIINGYLVIRQYYGYTKREALQMFKHETRKE